MPIPILDRDAQLLAAQKRLRLRQRAYFLARRTDSTKWSNIEPADIAGALVAILVFLIAVFACLLLFPAH